VNATDIIEQFKALPARERAQVTKYFMEHCDSPISNSFKPDMADAVLAKWRGRGLLPVGKNTDDYLGLTRDADGC
jgi:hypothetical protein